MQKRQKIGQGLVEFALILPVLLLVIVGTIEFGRLFLLYANVSNAAREATRYGMVNPTDYTGINNRVTESFFFTPPGTVNINVRYDSGPGTSEYTDPNDVVVGHRVIVSVNYPVDAMTPIFDPFIAADYAINIRNARTVQSLKPVWVTPSLAPGIDTDTPTPTPADTDTPTPDPSHTDTPTPDPSNTETPTLTPTPELLDPIIIDKPLWAGTTIVQGTAEPNEAVVVRIVQTGYTQSGLVDASGNFNFNVWPVLVGGHTVIVQGYGQQDLAIVQAMTPTPTPVATPSGPYILISPTCTNDQITTIHVTWGNWSQPAKVMQIYWDNDLTNAVCSGNINAGGNGCDFDAFAAIGTTYNVTGIARKKLNDGESEGTNTVTFERPCPGPTPTPTPGDLPDLQITGISLQDTPPLGTYDTLHISVGVYNAGQTDVASLFWVDLYTDPVGDLTTLASVDYVALNAIAAGSTVSFTMFVPNGFKTTGVHTLQAMVDTWDQILETDETNNISASLPVTITIDNPAPPPTPTPVGTLPPPGNIQGVTYLSGVRQGNVSVYIYDAEGRLWGSARSSSEPLSLGYYEIFNIPAGDYTVVGQLRIADDLYIGQISPVTVLSGQPTVGVNIDLDEVP